MWKISKIKKYLQKEKVGSKKQAHILKYEYIRSLFVPQSQLLEITSVSLSVLIDTHQTVAA